MRSLRLLVVLLASSLVLAACGRVADTATTTAKGPPTTAPEARSIENPPTTTSRLEPRAGLPTPTEQPEADDRAESPKSSDTDRELRSPATMPASAADPTASNEAPVETSAVEAGEAPIVPTTTTAAAPPDTATTSTPFPQDAADSAQADAIDDESSIADLDVQPATDADDSEPAIGAIEQETTTTTSGPSAPSTTIQRTTTTEEPSPSTTVRTTTTIAEPAPATTIPPTTIQPTTTTTTTSAPTTTVATTAPAPVRPANLSSGPAEVALVLVDQINVYPSASAAGADRTFERTTQFGNPTVFLIAGRQGTRLKVLLPVRQKHTYGWVDAADVQVSGTDLRAVISLSNRDVSLYRGNELLSADTAVIGKSSTPTPVGSFFVTDKLRHANPAGGYGPWIVALSARSEALTSFNGGEPLIAIHGTNKPWLVGGRHSNGCIRLPNDAITAIAQLVPLGTPVDIVA